MLKTAHAIIQKTADRIGLDKSEVEFLFKADDEHVFEIETSDGSTFKAYRVQHNSKLGPNKGGVRFHPEVDLDEARGLATLMTLKTAAVGLPLGGGKGGVSVDVRKISEDQLEEIARKYASHLAPHIGPGKDVPAPDVNTNSKVIDWMVDEFEKETGENTKGSFTGKSIPNKGSLGREAATGRGGYIALKEVIKSLHESKKSLTIAIQGFGNVGYWFAHLANQDDDFKVVAVSDSRGAVKSEGEIDSKSLLKCKKQKGSVISCTNDNLEVITAEELISLDVDVLAFAALGGAVNDSNYDQIKAKYVIELANGPIEESAHDKLSKKGSIIIPDIIANSGGVIVSYLEMLQNQNNEQWSEDDVNRKLNEYMIKAVDEMMSVSKSQDVTLKEAAFEIALKKLV